MGQDISCQSGETPTGNIVDGCSCVCSDNYYLARQGDCRAKGDVGDACDMLYVGDAACLDGLTCGITPDYVQGLAPVCH